jgi:succinoglycan biosynthesis protein ExoA
MSDPAELPLVSVIMPVRNEAQYIRRSLGALLDQDYPANRLEVIVLDGMSSDETYTTALETATTQSRVPVQLLRNEQETFAAGFNVGLTLARGDVVIMMGGHTIVARSYVSACVKWLQIERVDCVGGYIETVPTNPQGETIAIAMGSAFGVGGVGFRTKRYTKSIVDTVAFGAYRRDTLTRLGAMDEELVKNQDDEYNYRLNKMGGTILLAPDINCQYYSRTTMHTLAVQYFNYGMYKVRVLQKHRRQMRLRQFVPPAFVGALLGTLPLSYYLRGLWPFLIVIVSYAVSNVVVSTLIARRKGFRHFVLLPVAFTIMHVAYGVGFWVGVLRFWNRWQVAAIAL